jgi:hypothetical protein
LSFKSLSDIATEELKCSGVFGTATGCLPRKASNYFPEGFSRINYSASKFIDQVLKARVCGALLLDESLSAMFSLMMSSGSVELSRRQMHEKLFSALSRG